MTDTFTDEQVERIAEEFYYWQTGRTSGFETSGYRGNWISGTRKVLAAATDVAPPAPSADREKLMEAMRKGELLRQAAWNAYAQEPEGEGTRPRPDNWYRAESVLALLKPPALPPVDEESE